MALAEMAFAGGLGIEANLADQPTGPGCDGTVARLFSESNARYVVEVRPAHLDAFSTSLRGIPLGRIGTVVETQILRVQDASGRTVIKAEIDRLKSCWQAPLSW